MLVVGHWELVSGTRNGKPYKSDFNRIKVDRIAWCGSVLFYYRMDPTKSPKQIDWYYDGKVWRGIYEVTETELRLCQTQAPNPRPTEFATKPNDGRSYNVRRRVFD